MKYQHIETLKDNPKLYNAVIKESDKCSCVSLKSTHSKVSSFNTYFKNCAYTVKLQGL